MSSADTGWIPAARLTGHSQGSLSWRLQDPYLGLDIFAGGAHGAPISPGAGMNLASDGKLS
jgi:hypothetical protein